MDVKLARVINENVYLEPLEGYPEAVRKVLKLKKALYKLKQSPKL